MSGLKSLSLHHERLLKIWLQTCLLMNTMQHSWVNFQIGQMTKNTRIPLKRGVLDTTLCDKVCQWLAAGRWFSLGTPVSFTNRTDCNEITDILLKVALNITTHPPTINTENKHVLHAKNTIHVQVFEISYLYINYQNIPGDAYISSQYSISPTTSWIVLLKLALNANQSTNQTSIIIKISAH